MEVSACKASSRDKSSRLATRFEEVHNLPSERQEKGGEGNGVKPIKNECIKQLLTQGWTTETQFADEKHSTLGETALTPPWSHGMG